MEAGEVKASLAIVLLNCMLAGCMQRPADLEGNLKGYETLAALARQQLKAGQILDRPDASGQMKALMAELDVHRVRFDIAGTYVALSGGSNIFTGQFSYVYSLGVKPLELNEGPSIRRAHLTGRWYSERASW
jgi:hypothetical protein